MAYLVAKKQCGMRVVEGWSPDWVREVRKKLRQIKNVRTRIKRAVFKLVRANPGKMTTYRLIFTISCQSKFCGDEVLLLESLIAGVIWAMEDCGELVSLKSHGFNLGPRAPKLRKK